MERESFEDEEIGKILSENFVCIKLDREERPDVDKVYMTFVQVGVQPYYIELFSHKPLLFMFLSFNAVPLLWDAYTYRQQVEVEVGP